MRGVVPQLHRRCRVPTRTPLARGRGTHCSERGCPSGHSLQLLCSVPCRPAGFQTAAGSLQRGLGSRGDGERRLGVCDRGPSARFPTRRGPEEGRQADPQIKRNLRVKPGRQNTSTESERGSLHLRSRDMRKKPNEKGPGLLWGQREGLSLGWYMDGVCDTIIKHL